MKMRRLKREEVTKSIATVCVYRKNMHLAIGVNNLTPMSANKTKNHGLFAFRDYYAISPDESESSDDSNSADRIVNGKAASISNHRFIVNIRTCPHAPRA